MKMASVSLVASMNIVTNDSDVPDTIQNDMSSARKGGIDSGFPCTAADSNAAYNANKQCEQVPAP